MAFSVSQPSYSLLPSDNLTWSTAYSTNYADPAFVYTFAIQIGQTSGSLATVATLRVPPLPGATSGTMAPNSVLRNYVDTQVDFTAAIGGTGSSLGLQYSRIIYGTEYSSGGTTVATIGATGSTKQIWSAVFNNEEWVEYNPAEWIIGATSTMVRFLTDGPTTRCVLPQDLLYVNVSDSASTVYTKEDLFPPNSWLWGTSYDVYPDFFDTLDSTASPTVPIANLTLGATGQLEMTPWPQPSTVGNTDIYARAMNVYQGDTITIRIENATAYGSTSTNYPRLQLVGLNNSTGLWDAIGYLNVTITILPSSSFASLTVVAAADYIELGLRYAVTTLSQLGTPSVAGPVTTWTITSPNKFYWNIEGSTGTTQYELISNKQNWLNVPQTSGQIGCDVYITDKTDTIISEIITYDPDCQTCSPCELITLTWLNSKGGYDTYRFRCVNNKTLEATRVNGQQTLPQTPAFGTRGLYNSSNIAQVKSKINTNYMGFETVTWLESLFMSPSVYEVDDAGVLSGVIVDQTSYQRFATPDRLMVVEFDITRSILRSSQIK